MLDTKTSFCWLVKGCRPAIEGCAPIVQRFNSPITLSLTLSLITLTRIFGLSSSPHYWNDTGWPLSARVALRKCVESLTPTARVDNLAFSMTNFFDISLLSSFFMFSADLWCTVYSFCMCTRWTLQICHMYSQIWVHPGFSAKHGPHKCMTAILKSRFFTRIGAAVSSGNWRRKGSKGQNPSPTHISV